VASGPSRAPLLVVLPALTWQGLNPVDENGDGIPATLTSGGPVALARPLSHGLPPGFADEAGVLSYLDASHRHYEVTTDLGLIDGVGPRLNGHAGVVLAGAAQWVPAAIGAAFRTYVTAGGHVLSLGLDSLQRGVTVRSGHALAPTAARTVDALGATRGTPVDHNQAPLIATVDQLGIFQNSLPAYPSYQPLPSVTSPSQILAAAGAKPNQPSIIGYDLGRGTVFQVAVVGFGASLSRSAAARALTARILKSF
jgi:hypothetical protein